MTIWLMRTACWITKSTNVHSQYVILIAFPLQQWLHERASVLRYTYIACLVLGENQISPGSILQRVHFIRNLYLSLSLPLGFYCRGQLSYLVTITPPNQFIS
jgi:hypothetical protein